MDNYLEHHGILGQRWGVRRYQNPDGTLTAEGKRHYDNYTKTGQLAQQVYDEGQKLLNSNKQLKYDFGSSYSNVDDDEFFDMVAREYGLDTNKYWKANTDYKTFYNQNYESIKIGQKIVEQLSKK